MKNEEIDDVFKDLYGMLMRLRVENEVNKVLLGSLSSNILRGDSTLSAEVLDSVGFIADIVETQIEQQWSEQEAQHFRQLIEQEKKKLYFFKKTSIATFPNNPSQNH